MTRVISCRVTDEEFDALIKYCKEHGLKHHAEAVYRFVMDGIIGVSERDAGQWVLLSEIKDLLVETLDVSAGSLASTMLLRDQIIPSNTPIEDRKRLAKEFIADSLFAGEAIVTKRRTGEYKKEKS